jgi:hypothetical protein
MKSILILIILLIFFLLTRNKIYTEPLSLYTYTDNEGVFHIDNSNPPPAGIHAITFTPQIQKVSRPSTNLENRIEEISKENPPPSYQKKILSKALNLLRGDRHSDLEAAID